MTVGSWLVSSWGQSLSSLTLSLAFSIGSIGHAAVIGKAAATATVLDRPVEGTAQSRRLPAMLDTAVRPVEAAVRCRCTIQQSANWRCAGRSSHLNLLLERLLQKDRWTSGRNFRRPNSHRRPTVCEHMLACHPAAAFPREERHNFGGVLRHSKASKRRS